MRLFLSFLCFWTLVGVGQQLPDGFVWEVFAENVNLPTQMVQAPDGRVFIAEKGGKIRVVEDGILLDEAFYAVETEIPGERGITGLLLHPDFDQNGFVYLHYSLPDQNRNTLLRVTSGGNTAIPGSEYEVFTFDQMWAAWHNGGGMVFDQNGDIVLGVGDGSGWQNGQRPYTHLGKVVRLKDDGSIPEYNPFVDPNDGIPDEILAFGIRNPYTMAIQESTGRIFFNDVGGDAWEEVNEVVEGMNYGWADIEGPIQPEDQAPENYVDPIYAYDHSEGCAILGADFYEPSTLNFPESFHGRYIFMEHCRGEVFTMNPDNFDVSLFADGFQLPNTLLVLNDGSLLIAEIYNNRILRVQYTGSGVPFISEQSQNTTTIVGDDLNLYVNVLSETAWQAQWYRNGEILEGETSGVLALSNLQIDETGDAFTCIVSNDFGSAQSEPIIVTVLDESRPEVTMVRPIEGQSYQAGDTLWFEGLAFDNEDGALNTSSLEWNIFFHHNVHKHPALTNQTGIAEGYYVIPNQGETATDVWFRVHLKAEDSAGLATEHYVDVHPDIVTIDFVSEPSELVLSIDGSEINTTESISSVAKLKRTLKADEHLVQNNGLYVFNDWNHPTHNDLLYSFSALDTTLTPRYSYLHEYIRESEEEDPLAQYFSGTDSTREFHSEEYVSVIDGNFNKQNPINPWDFPVDEFSILYTGSILAPYTGTYKFHVFHDGSVDFRVSDSLVISNTVPNGYKETDVALFQMEAGNRYNFVLDYKHHSGFSRIRLGWSFSVIDEEAIPASQLMLPKETFRPSNLSSIGVYPNPSNGNIKVFIGDFWEEWSTGVSSVAVYDYQGKIVKDRFDYSFKDTHEITGLNPGFYLLRLTLNGEERVEKMIVK